MPEGQSYLSVYTQYLVDVNRQAGQVDRLGLREDGVARPVGAGHCWERMTARVGRPARSSWHAIVLAVLRHDQRLADLAGGNRISATTVRRWEMEVIELLAVRAPRLERALKKITRKGGHVVLIDGTLIRTRIHTWGLEEEA
ncbi:hypothetical protein [Streptomyces atratus]|uniref:hypothetical protein n=1 Tax=Streptomyces atratus TaxID=1893 RepID=UPI0033CB223D